MKKLLMISTDRKLFEKGSEVARRQAEYAKNWDEVHIVVFAPTGFGSANKGSSPTIGPADPAEARKDTMSKPLPHMSPSSRRQASEFIGSANKGSSPTIGPADPTERSAGPSFLGGASKGDPETPERAASEEGSEPLFASPVNTDRHFMPVMIAPNCWAYSTESHSRFMYPLDAIRLGRFIVERRGITQITCQDASLTAMAGASLKKRFGLPLEIQVHEDIGSPLYAFNVTNKIRKAMALSNLSKADTVRVVSERIRNYIVNTLHVDGSRIIVRPINVDTEAVRSAPIIRGANLRAKYPQFTKIALVASRLNPEKNVRLAVKAWAKVAAEMPSAGLVIVGEGPRKNFLKRFAAKLGLCGSGAKKPVQKGLFGNDRIIFEPWADKDTLYSYYKTADVLINTSLFEGYGMTLVEARAAGLHMVSTDVGVAAEVGATIAPPDADLFAQAVVKVLKS